MILWDYQIKRIFPFFQRLLEKKILTKKKKNSRSHLKALYICLLKIHRTIVLIFSWFKVLENNYSPWLNYHDDLTCLKKIIWLNHKANLIDFQYHFNVICSHDNVNKSFKYFQVKPVVSLNSVFPLIL